jgi:diguanylate cyclase (GGDEF)-like protein
VKLTDKRSSYSFAALLALVLVISGAILSSQNSLQRLDFVFYDSLLALQNNPVNDDIVIVAIDDASIQSLGRWPWSRSTHAQIIDRLTELEARAIGIDIIFAEPEQGNDSADLSLQKAISNNGRVVLPVVPARPSAVEQVSEILPMPGLTIASHSLGHVDVELDVDGICRRFFLFAGIADARWPAFSLAMVNAAGESIYWAESQKTSQTGSGWLRQVELMIPYAGEQGIKTLSYADVLNGRIPKEAIKNKYVFIGATAAGLGDVISTPASKDHERMAGVELNAHILNGMLNNSLIHRLSDSTQIAVTSILILVSAIIIVLLPVRLGFIAMMLALAGIISMSFILLVFQQYWFSPSAALLMIMLISPIWSIWQFSLEAQLKRNLLNQLDRQAKQHIATGLPNHHMLENKLRQLDDSSNDPSNLVALMILHLNWPGSISVLLGRPKGDAILKTIAEKLYTSLPGDSFIAHLTGDDFAVLINDMKNLDRVKKVAYDLLLKLQEPVVHENQEFMLAPQVGVSTWPTDGEAESLLRNAYTAVFRSRIDETEKLCIYSADIGQQLQARSQVEQALIHALERNEFTVHYQPQVNAQTGKIVGVESLIRWKSEVLGWVGPDSFIPIAEHVGLIKSIGEWVIRTACLQLKEWNEAGLGPIRLAINVSPLQFMQPRLNHNIREIIDEIGIPAAQLEIEITESSVMRDLEGAIKVMHQIKHGGMELAIDDFGTGYSSLSNLRHFPVNRLKIDQAFTREIGKSKDATEITLTILAMGKRLGLGIIAEGVETLEQAEFLRENGCDEFQGYLYSKPLSGEELTQILVDGIDTTFL